MAAEHLAPVRPERRPDLAPGFEALDAFVRAADACGVAVVRVAGPREAVALAHHLERRGLAQGRSVVRAAGSPVESVWRDIARRVDFEPPHDPREAAAEMTRRLARKLVLVPVLVEARWDAQVTQALQEAESQQALIVIILTQRARVPVQAAASFEVPSELDAASSVLWWEAFAEMARRRRSEQRLVGLEQWQRAALDAEVPNREPILSVEASQLLARLSLAQRAWPRDALQHLGVEDVGTALGELERHGLTDSADNLVVPVLAEPRMGARSSAGAANETDRRVLAAALEGCFSEDAWAFARAAELLAANLDEGAEERMRRAFQLAADAPSRVQLWARWRQAVESLPADGRASAQLRGAELALDLGDVDIALEWAERAAGSQPGPEAALLLGRAALARGDLVSAEAALNQARQDAEYSVRALVELAEVKYAAGELGGAEELARDALGQASVHSAVVRLGARNLLGKLLLAAGEWDAADQHFAADACDAACAGERLCELRARVNRAIALLSRGSTDEARPILRQVLQDGEEGGELRAVGFALSNLAVLAIERHEYRHALELSERAIGVRRRLGERLGFARDVTNLVELRLRLGLVDQAEEALLFGRQALGPGAPASRMAELGLAASRVHLARGRTLEAEREVRSALRTATLASDGDKLGECHRLAARIALEDGVLRRAEAEVERAHELSNTPFARGEVSILELLLARASGQDAAALTQRAVISARESGDEELAREAHIAAAEVLLGGGDEEGAREHVRAACVLRDEVARGIGPDLARAYCSRSDLKRLATLEATLPLEGHSNSEEAEPVTVAPRRRGRGKRASGPRFLGNHPQVRKLLSSVQKVASTDATVLVRGESGTGKELVAEAIHQSSDRASGPLVKVNCAALVETLLLSELFGHEKGAFTGANSRKRGRFERANGGTLFLDEIGDISHRTQVALLRALEERSVERVGGSAPIPVDVRIVCATNRDLRSMVERGEFREDLYYRLAGITLEVPALRERLSDLAVICDGLLDRVSTERGEIKKRLSTSALELLSHHRWPGNVRELENAVRVASLFAEGDELHAPDFADHIEALSSINLDAPPNSTRLTSATLEAVPPSGTTLLEAGPLDSLQAPAEAPATGVAYREIRESGLSLADLKRKIERECIARALTETSGNITRAAEVLGMKRPRLSQLVKQYGLNTTELPASRRGGAGQEHSS